MPYAIHVDPASNLVVVQFSGTVTAEEIVQAAKAIAAHLERRTGAIGVADGTSAEASPIRRPHARAVYPNTALVWALVEEAMGRKGVLN